jgi:hypothetical protein
MKAVPLLVCATLLACGSPTDRGRCGSDSECPNGARCELTGDGGICWPADFVAITDPAGGLVGGGGREVIAKLVLGRAGGIAPATLELVAGTTVAGTLQRRAEIGAETEYAGVYVPAGGTDGPVTLTVRATVGGTVLASAPVVVTVDTTAPSLSSLTVSCSVAHPDGRCRRDDALLVSARATDANGAAVAVTLDVDGNQRVQELVAAGGDLFSATLQLRDWPFAAFERNVVASVTALDAVRNAASATASLPVTRLRWARAPEAGVFSLTGVAVVNEGLLAVGATNGKLYRVNPQGDLVGAPTQLGGAIAFAPSVGPTAIWVGSDDTRLYAVDPATGAILNGAGCATGGAVRGPPAVTTAPPETAFVTRATGAVHAARVPADCRASGATGSFETGPVLDREGAVLALAAIAELHKFVFDGAVFSQSWTSSVGASASVAIAIGALDETITASQQGGVAITSSLGATVPLAVVGAASDAPIVIANGDVVVPVVDGSVRRLSSNGTQVWSTSLGQVAGSALALVGGDVRFVVPTRSGAVHALGDDGTVRWSGGLADGSALTTANIHTAPGSTTSTLYVGGGNTLFAVIVDGRLDTSAPWPKAHHDTRNSGNAAGPLP